MGVLRAQDTIRTLIISEARIDNMHSAYYELTNVGTDTLDLSKFEVGRISPWTTPYNAIASERLMLPKKKLAPGKSFVIAKVNDFVQKMWAKSPDLYNHYESKPEMDKLADVKVHIGESPKAVPQSLDSISPFAGLVTIWNGSYSVYIRHHISATDSVVVDQVGGIYDEADGTSYDIMHDVAGVTNATGNSVLIRKFKIKKGNLDFNTGRGTNAAESEWIVVPFLLGGWEPERAVFWTTGNHGDYHLSSLTSSVLTVDWNANTITVPWGVRNDDSIMYKFNRVPGIAWHYDYSKNHNDSAYISVRTGDKLTLYACGNEVEKAVLDVIALPATDNDNLVIPKRTPDRYGNYPGRPAFCQVTDKAPGIDTIMGFPAGCRVDTLLKYLEKPAQASWEIVWVDGIQRADLKVGDKLKVTSKNGASKEYYIKTNKYFPSHNAYLSYITWPDIPASYKGDFGWNGDTIPNFLSSKLNYKVTVPWDVDGIPALIAKKQQLNATLKVTKANNLSGSAADRTITFTNTAEDDTTVKVYTVELEKQIDETKVQPWDGDPFISQFIFKQDYNNDFLEIVNPRPGEVDMSNYMVTFGYYGSAAEAITRVSGTGDFANRYNKYIPGYKWVDEATWASTPAVAVPDLAVNPMVKGGDVFVCANIRSASTSGTYPAFVINQIDIDFNHNPWGDNLSGWGQSMQQWWGEKFMLFKILNDSVKNGLKPANDPDDFELIDVVGNVSGDRIFIGGLGMDQVTQYVRKPYVWKGNPVIGGSNGNTEDSSEWIMMNEGRYGAAGYGWPATRIMVADGIGSHFMKAATVYRSTVSSSVYKVEDGYVSPLNIKGILAATTVNSFYTNIIKADTGQHLKVKAVADGSILAGTGTILNGDTLIVVSADSSNTTKYVIEVAPLSDNAVLTSVPYTIGVAGSNGTVGGFAYGTKLKDIVAGVTVPAGASIIVIDSKGAYVPMKTLNFDTVYVDVLANDQIFFEVTAENGSTKITYQLKPNVASTDALVTSDVYTVDQTNSLIKFIPNGTAVIGFKPNIIPCTGASIKVVDKLGLERTTGLITKDDKLVVTAADGVTKRVYHLLMLGDLPNYLAYVSSGVYAVDQVSYKIAGSITTSMTVGDLLANLSPADYAKITVYTFNGTPKTAGQNLTMGDVVQVVSGDGKAFRTYEITNLVKAENAKTNVVRLFPNPAIDNISIDGIESGSTILVYNAMGKLVIGKVAKQETELLTLSAQPKGVYLVKVITKGKKEFTSKIVKK
jgi:hypothetical protein